MDKIFGDIFDIKFSNDQCYLLKACNLSSKQIESEVRSFPAYQEGYSRDLFIENKVLLPPIVFHFYKIVFENQSTPHPDILWDSYLSCFQKFEDPTLSDFVNLGNKIQLPVKGIKGRFMRTYPSLVRDLYLFCLIKEARYFDNTSYSLQADYYEGADIKISKNGITAHINIYMETPNACSQRTSKSSRWGRIKPAHIKDIELKLPKTLIRIVNNYFLPEKKCVDLVIKKFEELEV